jgi:hypothetical protein
MSLERLPKETEKSYSAFLEYVKMGWDRSLRELAVQSGRPLGSLETWSLKFAWKERLEEHSRHLAKMELDVAEALAKDSAVDWIRRQEEQRKAEWAARCKLLEMAHKAIQRWEDNPNRCESLASIARVLDLASKLGRLASGMATDRTEMKTEFEGQLDMDWELAIRKVYGAPAEVVDVEARRLSDANT